VQTRPYGETGVKLSVVGFGGIVVMDETPADAKRFVAEAIDRGINYFDVAPTYGNAEERLGPALEPYRKKVFLACKTGKRTKEAARAELEGSLKRLRTDYFDLYQFHGVSQMSEVEQIFARGGAIETFLMAREEGLLRYLGFSAHSEEAAIAMMERFQFDSVLFPFNYVCWHQGKFGPAVIKKAQEKGVALLGLKALAKRMRKGDEKRRFPKCWYKPVENPEEAEISLRFALSLPLTSAVSPSEAELLWWECEAAEKFKPLSMAEAEEVRSKTEGLKPIFPQ